MTQVELLRRIAAAKSPVCTVAVSSGKGGVGKTTISVALSKFLSDMGYKVCLIDGDLGLANVDILLGLSSKLNLYHIARGEASLEDVLVEVKEGFFVLPGGSGIRELLTMGLDMRRRIALELLKLDGEVDYVIADTAAGIADEVLMFCVSCQDVLMVVTPEPTSMTDAYALMKTLNREFSRREFAVVVNMVEGDEDAGVFAYLEAVTGRFLSGVRLKRVGQIPRSRKVPLLVREQSADALDSLKGLFAPVVEAVADGNIFQRGSGGISRLAMGFLRFRGAGAGSG